MNAAATAGVPLGRRGKDVVSSAAAAFFNRKRKNEARAMSRDRDSGRIQRLWLLAGLLALLAAAALPCDLAVARHFHMHPLRGDLKRLVHLAEVFGYGGSVAMILITVAILDVRGPRAALLPGVTTSAAGLVANVAKLLVGRLRPHQLDWNAPLPSTFLVWLPWWMPQRLGRPYTSDVQSFPSGHAAAAAGLAIGLACLYPRGRWWFACLAALAGLQRLAAEAHYLSDVLAGAALGCLAAAACLAAGADRLIPDAKAAPAEAPAARNDAASPPGG
jgi:membrane-associated phospholipid phosphatase